MTTEHAENQAGHTPEAVGLNALTEEQRVMGVRFFAAARAGSEEAARNLLTQEIKPTDKKLRNEGVYNPVLEGISIAERKDYWEKEGNPYKEALDKWRNRFTTLVNQVTDETRIAAFKSILPDDPALKDKALNEIDQDDATRLFGEYSENKSDIDLFMRRAITNLTAQGVLEPDALQAHISHLRWIATGFFGKETASMIGTQILLEVERKNNPFVISEFIDENLDRVNSPNNTEIRFLTDVQEKAVRFAATPAAQPAQPVVQVPVYDEDDLLPPPIEDSGMLEIQPEEKEDGSEKNKAPEPQQPTNTNAVKANPAARPQDATLAQTRGPDTPGANLRTTIETVKELGEGNKPLIEELNDELRSTTKDYITFVVPPRKLMEYMISAFAEGKKVEVGKMEVSRDDKITISRVRISQTGGGVTVNNITINNNPRSPGSISATHGKIQKEWLGKALAGDVGQKISTMNDVFLTELKKKIAPRNPSWTPKNLSVSKGMITVGFDRGQTTS